MTARSKDRGYAGGAGGRGREGWRWRGSCFGGDRRGVLLVEYALIAAVTGMIAVAAIVTLGGSANTPLRSVQAALQTALHDCFGGGPGPGHGDMDR